MVLQIGRRCTFGGDPGLALKWYGLLPERMDNDPDLGRAIRLARGGAYYQLFAFEEALPEYRALAADEAAEPRDEILHAAAVCAGRAGLADEAGRYTQALHRGWPAYPRLAEAYTAWVDALLQAGRDDEALALAGAFAESLPDGHPARQPLDFAAATASYRLEQFAEAARAFGQFVADFPDAERAPDARYYRASSLVQARQWAEALPLLGALASDPTAEAFLDGILYYQGLCRFLLDNPTGAETSLTRLIENFPESKHRPAGSNLLGDVQLQAGRWEDAEATYAAGAEAADAQAERAESAAYARAQQVRIAIARQAWTDALRRFKTLVAHHPRTPHLAEAATHAAHALDELDRSDEAVELLTRLARVFAGEARSTVLPTLLQAHHALYLRDHGAEALLRRLQDFPIPDPVPPSLAAWLLMGQIETLEDLGRTPDDSRLHACYHALTTTFDLDVLSDYFLLKLARWLHQGGQPDRARTYYAVLTDYREPSDYTHHARIEFATLLADVGSEEAFDRALGYLRDIQSGSDSPDLQERAAAEEARILSQREAWGRRRRGLAGLSRSAVVANRPRRGPLFAWRGPGSTGRN